MALSVAHRRLRCRLLASVHDRRRRDPVRHRGWRHRATRWASRGSGGSPIWPGRAARCRSSSVARTRTARWPRRSPAPRHARAARARRGRARRPDGPRDRAALGRGPRDDRRAVWPARMVWVGPETVTSLIEAHGTDPATSSARPGRASPAGRCSCRSAHLEALASGRARPDAADGRRRRSSPDVADPARRARRSGRRPRSSTRRSSTCRRTKGRPSRRPATATSGAPTSPPRLRLLEPERSPLAPDAGRRRPATPPAPNASRSDAQPDRSRLSGSPRVAGRHRRYRDPADHERRPPRAGAATAPRRAGSSPATTVMTGWASRMIEVRTAGSRGSDSEISR